MKASQQRQCDALSHVQAGNLLMAKPVATVFPDGSGHFQQEWFEEHDKRIEDVVLEKNKQTCLIMENLKLIKFEVWDCFLSGMSRSTTGRIGGGGCGCHWRATVLIGETLSV